MKKIILFLMVICSVFYFYGCNLKLQQLTDNISELQTTYFLYEDDNYSISMISGIREKEYILDGHHTENINYCVVMIEQTTFDTIDNINLRVNGNDYTASPLLNPYNNNYVFDFEMAVVKQSIVMLSFCDKFFTLTNIMQDLKYSHIDCLKDLIKSHKIDYYFQNNNFSGEIFVRVIKLKEFDAIYYQILFVDKNSNAKQFLISPNTLEYV